MLQNIKQLTMSNSDILGVCSSLLCLLHCLAFPLFLSAGYLLNHSSGGHWHGMDYLFVLLGLIAAWASGRKTASRGLKLGFWLTISVFSLSVSLHDRWFWMIYVSALASLILIALHVVHW